MSIVATMAGVLTMIAFWLRFSTFFGGFGGWGRGGDGAAGLLIIIVMSILIPIAAAIIKMVISRPREYQAGSTGGSLGGNPNALAHALEKLEVGAGARPMRVNQAVSDLFIINPLRGGSWAG